MAVTEDEVKSMRARAYTIRELPLTHGIDPDGRYWGFVSKEPLWYLPHPLLDTQPPERYMNSMAFCRAGNLLKAAVKFNQRIEEIKKAKGGSGV
jgi:hypothetical protein